MNRLTGIIIFIHLGSLNFLIALCLLLLTRPAISNFFTWLDVAQFLPVRKPISQFLYHLHYWLEDQESMTASLWLSKIEDLQVFHPHTHIVLVADERGYSVYSSDSLITLPAFSGKHNVTVCRPSVCQSHRHTHHDSTGDLASIHLSPTIRRTDIFVFSLFHVLHPEDIRRYQLHIEEQLLFAFTSGQLWQRHYVFGLSCCNVCSSDHPVRYSYHGISWPTWAISMKHKGIFTNRHWWPD